MIILLYLFYSLIGFFSLTVGFLSIQIFAGIIRSGKFTANLTGERKTVTVIIPAHNEKLVIVNTLQRLMPHIIEGDQVVVVADNCTDNTAELANNFDVNVVKRTDTVNRGKGYALDFGLKEAQKKPTDIVIILDADCLVHAHLINQLAIAANTYQRPIQALYLMLNKTNCSIKQKIAEFAFLIKNKLRPIGLKTLHLPCQLMGTGMAFPWLLIKQVDLANGNLVEDMKLGVDFVIQKKGAVFLPNVMVTSYFPNDTAVLEAQRTRWEHGHISTVLSFVPYLLFSVLKNFNIKALFFALDLMILPLAFLTILIIFTYSISLILWFFSISLLMKIMSLITMIFVVAVMSAWFFEARKIIKLTELIRVPMYVLSKLTIYKRLFGDKEKGWVKTKR